MNSPAKALDVFLTPGEFRFGDAHMRLHTVLGSCVAITLWHPRRHIGGMCHYVLPERRRGAYDPLDGHYAEDAMQLFMHEVRARRTRIEDYEVKLFGGGSMFDHELSLPPMHGDRHDPLDVALRNIQRGHELVARHGLHLAAEHLGGLGHRNVIFDIGSGDVWVRHVSRRT